MHLGVANAFALLRLLPRSDRDKDAEIVALRHQIIVLQRHLGPQKIRFEPADRCWQRCCTRFRGQRYGACGCWYAPTRSCAGIATWSPRHHAAVSRPRRRGRPGTLRSIRPWLCDW